ncbi:deoxycytidylate deaminase-like [Bolinopsis microptera]|uniref:deoxycytidylate deaminase-like n=1 Tax=Bolinopsis microptera TaxID=2820187 RepID=UPI003079445B
MKRSNYLDWDTYFMSVAFLTSQRSKDPVTQVGACIVNPEKKIVGVGYNGMPTGCNDDQLPWGREGETMCETKYAFVCHAEMNAVLNKNSADVKGCTIYVSLFPCNECTKIIIQGGISKIVYFSKKNSDSPSHKASVRMLELAGVSFRQFIPKEDKFVIDFNVYPDVKYEAIETEEKENSAGTSSTDGC